MYIEGKIPDKENIKIELPKDVIRIISALEADNNQAYAVGGCVRDSILGKYPKDWDITTSALPMRVKGVFKKTVDTGIKHGTVTVMLGKTGYEVTTYRVDGEYEDGRHPKSVEFAISLKEDLQRRDFTINAMAYNPNGGLVDEFNGLEDLKNKKIRCVGNPKDRFTEDALRMMRAVRFSAQLEFEIEEETLGAVKELCGNINKVSRERIHAELNKILLSEHPDHVLQLYEAGLTEEILPVIHEILGGKRSKITRTMLKVSEKDLILRYAALMQEAGEKNVFETMKSLKLDNCTIDTVTMLVKYSKDDIAENEPGVREAIHKYGRDFFPLLLKHQKMILQAKEAVTDIMLSERKRHIDTLYKMYLEIIRRGDCISVKDLDISGTDLMEYGLSGPRIGATLNELLHIVMENPKLNDKEILISMIENR